jgi:hypothetical protein
MVNGKVTFFVGEMRHLLARQPVGRFARWPVKPRVRQAKYLI